MIARRVLFALVALACACGLSFAQGARDVRVDLRVTGVAGAGRVVIDHGAEVGLAVDDRIVFRPRTGEPVDGVVVGLEGRRATVALTDPGRDLAVGTRAEAWIPRSRLEAAPEEDQAEGAQEVEPDVEPGEEDGGDAAETTPVVTPEHPPWERDEWEPGMPLLSEIRAVLPEDREVTLSGRAYSIYDQTITTDSDRSQHFWRTGADVTIDNPYGRGGSLNLDAELNFRRTRVPDDEDEDRGRLRIDRLSYTLGGTRFRPERIEFGRFLQRVPEFGVLDGIDYERRVEGGNRIGVSVGYLPEPDYEQKTGRDLQISAHYEWLYDESERFTVLGGFQKTWHEGDADRDLFLARVRFLPPGPWSFHGAAWIDLYRPDDEVKDGGTEITQAYATATRTFESGDGLSFGFDRLRYPELLRDEFRPPDPATLLDGGYDRIHADGWRWLNERQRFHARLGLWDGDEEGGGDLELGMDIERFQDRDARLTGDLFLIRGEFSSVFGGRVTYTGHAAAGDWYALYELSRHDQDGFGDDNDDLLQHRARGGRAFTSRQGWSLNGYGEAVVERDDVSLTLGVAFQHGF